MLERLRFRGLSPAAVVTAVVAAAFMIPTIGAAAHLFVASAYPVCSSVTLTAAPASPQPAGTAVVFTASAVGCAQPEYEFWMRAASQSSWQMIQGYSTTATYNWNSTGAAPGVVNFGVWAEDVRNAPAAGYEANTSIPYTISSGSVGACTAVTLTAAPTSVIQGSTTHSILTASATGCAHASPLYEFWARWAGSSTWQMVQTYSAVATYDWNSSGALPGVETFGVWAKDAQSTATYDALGSTTVTVTAATCRFGKSG